MISAKTLYWLAVTMMGLFFLNSAALRHQDWLNRLEARSIQMTQQFSGDTLASVDSSSLNFDPQTSRCARVRSARVQDKLARMEAAIAGRHVRCAQVEARRAELESLQQIRVPVMPASQNFVIEVPQVKRVLSDGTI